MDIRGTITGDSLIGTVAMNNSHPPLKHIFEMDAAEDKRIEIYQAAASVRDKIGRSNFDGHIYINQLEKYINGATIQYHRIQMENGFSVNSQRRIGEQLLPSLSNRPLWNSMNDHLWDTNLMIFLDIHYYLICLDKIDKLYGRFLKSIATAGKELADVSGRRVKVKQVRKLFEQALQQTKDARGFLEHPDKIVQKGEFNGLKHEKNERGNWFTYGDDACQVCLNPEPIHLAYEALIEMLRTFPDVN